MILYILSRLKNVWLIATGIVFLGVIVSQYSHEMYYIFYYFAALTFGAGIGPNWGILFPYSRKRLLLWSAIESALYALGMFVIYVAMASLNFVLVGKSWDKDFIEITFYCVIGLGILRFCTPINRKSARSKVSIEAGSKLVLLLLGIFFVAMLGAKEPWLAFSTIATILIFIPLASFISFTPPVKTFRSAVKISATLSGSFVVLLLAGIYYFILFYPPVGLTRSALEGKGSLPIKISKERAADLLTADIRSDGVAHELLRTGRLASEQVKLRISKCTNEKCLHISTLIARKNSGSVEDVENFKEIVAKCSLKKNRHGVRSCSSIAMDREDWMFWLNRFSQTPGMSDWLASKDPNLQFLALQAIYHVELTDVQLKLVSTLRDSADLGVKTEARYYLDHHLKFLGQDRCKVPVVKDPVCKPTGLGRGELFDI